MKVLLFYAPGPGHLERMRQAAPGAEVVAVRDEEEAGRLAPRAEVVMGNRYFLQILPLAGRLRWFQSNSVGMDLVLTAGDRLKGITVTSAKGVYDGEIAEHGLAMSLALARRLNIFRDRQAARAWSRDELASLSGGRALIMGYGGVGKSLARLLAGIGMEVTAARRRAGVPEGSDRRVKVVWGEAWRHELAATDLLVLALPLTRATRRLVDRSAFEALKPGALVVNIGRGGTLDEAALLEMLKSGALGGAALDVFDREPLPGDSPLWAEPNLLITPHVARSKEQPPCRWEPLFAENLRRYASGLPLLNEVDIEAGY